MRGESAGHAAGGALAARGVDWRFAGILAACVAVAFVFWATPLLLPFRLFVSMVHELSHALMGVLTGGQVLGVDINLNGSGTTLVRGGNLFLVASAGYLGSTLFGALLLLVARGPHRREVLLALALGLVAAVVLAFRDPVGIVFGLLLAGAFWLLARRGPDWAVALVVYLLAVLNGLYALHDLLTLLHLSRGAPFAHSDAAILARLTGLPAVLWALLWAAVALAIQAWALRAAPTSAQAPHLAAPPALPARAGRRL